MKNQVISEMFERMADVLEFKGENVFKINAYRKASRIIQNLTEDIENIWKMGRLREIPGVGEGIAKKIDEYLHTGKMKKYDEVTHDVSDSLIELMNIPGMGSKTLSLVHKELGVKNLEDLKMVIEDGRLARLPKIGEKKVENIKRGIERLSVMRERLLLGRVLPLVEWIIEDLKKKTKVSQIAPAGSLRRMKETIGDIDILTAGKDGRRIIEQFTHLPQVKEILVSGETKGSIITHGGIQIDLRVVPEESFGAALQYFTGSKAHNIKLRDMAKSRGLKINEYGIFKGEVRLGGQAEEEIYSLLGLPWIPPELREDRGEIEASLEGNLPELVDYQDILGDLHIHSNYSDGTSSIEEIAIKARELGYKFVAICDHSQSVKYAGGLSEDQLLHQIEEIKEINERIDGIKILAGNEVDIKQDGTLDYPDSILAKLDIVIAAIHQGFRKQVTERMIKAMENPYVNIIAHPTGRLISGREGYGVNLDLILEKAAETNTLLEINAYYDRLDLNDINCRKAKKLGIRFSIGTDAHHVDQLWMIRLGVGVARRAWINKLDLINTYPLNELEDFLKMKIWNNYRLMK
ncbi:MAG: DNA polymerase/3'-5' exonuclease PolX [bacterium]|nr:DNA polymerase/3'-5' exonuclease PolX [bacterium]